MFSIAASTGLLFILSAHKTGFATGFERDSRLASRFPIDGGRKRPVPKRNDREGFASKEMVAGVVVSGYSLRALEYKEALEAQVERKKGFHASGRV